MDNNLCELTMYDRRIIHYYELKMYYMFGGFSLYTIINFLLLFIAVIIDLLVMTGEFSLNVFGLIILICANTFFYLKGPFIYINRNVFYRMKNRIKIKYDFSQLEARKVTGIFLSCEKNEESELFDLKLCISGVEYTFEVYKEIYQRTVYLRSGDYTEMFYLRNVGDIDNYYLVLDILDYKMYYKMYKKISKRNPKTNEKIKNNITT